MAILIILFGWIGIIVLFVVAWYRFRKDMPNDIEIMDKQKKDKCNE